MKRLIICMMAVFAIVACSKSDDVETGGGSGAVTPQAEITLYVASLQLSSLEKTEEISFTSTVAWSADVTDGDAWCSISPTNGNAGSAKIVVTATTNDSYDNREATIVIKAGDVEKSVSVKQAQKNAIVIADDKYEIGAEGGELCFEIQTNVDVEVEISENAIEWISHVETRALKNKTLIFEVQPSSLNDERMGTITIKGDDVEQVIDVVQRIAIPNNEIWYTTSDGAIITPNIQQVNGQSNLDAGILSNTYENGKGVIVFDKDLTRIGEVAFVNKPTLNTITLPYSLTDIETSAFISNNIENFYGKFASKDHSCLVRGGTLITIAMKDLRDYTVSDEVEVIGESAFANCTQLRNLIMHDNINTIEKVAFNGCINLQEVVLPKSLTTIGNGAFTNCTSLKEITIPESVITIGTNICRGCTSLTSFYGKYASTDNRCLIKDGELIAFTPVGLTEYIVPQGVTSIAGGVFASCDKLTKIVLPEGLTSIDGGMFYGCKALTTITIPESVTYIETGVFNGCENLTTFLGKFASADGRCLVIDGVLVAFAPAGIKNYTIPNIVQIIGNGVFDGNHQLVDVEIPMSVETIDKGAFRDCRNLETINIPNSVKLIEGSAFINCKSLKEIIIPNSVERVGLYAFCQCDNLERVVLPENLTKIEQYTFMNCEKLQEIVIPSKVEVIEKYAFFNCPKIIDIAIPDSVKIIDEYAFYVQGALIDGYCTIKLGDSVEYIGDYAFNYRRCSKILLPITIEYIGQFAFAWEYVEELYSKPILPPSVSNITLWGIFRIYVPTESVDAYKVADGWSDYADKIEGYTF